MPMKYGQYFQPCDNEIVFPLFEFVQHGRYQKNTEKSANAKMKVTLHKIKIYMRNLKLKVSFTNKMAAG